jgi:UDP-2,3-diacylglucosamine hydrolase
VTPLSSLTLSGAGELLFCSDVHLGEECPELTQPFLAWLNQALVSTQTVFILGDLFHAWIGDDLLDQDALYPETVRAAKKVSESLKAFTQAGGQAYFLAGNRDFLMGDRFFAQTGLRPLAQECLLAFEGSTWLLCHGDHLCVDDTPHQELRKTLLSPEWQKEFLAQPLSARADFASGLREKSRQAKTMKSDTIMDVNPQACLQRVRDLNCVGLIHGHTHRPGRYELAEGLTRWVIPDWQALPSADKKNNDGKAASTYKGGFLSLQSAGPELTALS